MRAFQAGRSPIERSFGAVYEALRWLGSRLDPAWTPAEAAGALSERLPQARQDVQVLLGAYQASVYSQNPGDGSAARRAAQSIRRQTLRAALRNRLPFIRRFFRKSQ